MFTYVNTKATWIMKDWTLYCCGENKICLIFVILNLIYYRAYSLQAADQIIHQLEYFLGDQTGLWLWWLWANEMNEVFEANLDEGVTRIHQPHGSKAGCGSVRPTAWALSLRSSWIAEQIKWNAWSRCWCGRRLLCCTHIHSVNNKGVHRHETAAWRYSSLSSGKDLRCMDPLHIENATITPQSADKIDYRWERVRCRPVAFPPTRTDTHNT